MVAWKQVFPLLWKKAIRLRQTQQSSAAQVFLLSACDPLRHDIDIVASRRRRM
jgi:hypothetical protein